MGTRKRRVSVIYLIAKLVKWDDSCMEIISGYTQGSIERASMALKNGSLVAFPTETVYGLGADATNEKAVSRIYSAKGRPTDHPLIVHISSFNFLDKWAIDIPEYALKLARDFWPGPMTLILKGSNLAKDFVTGGQESIGLRVPDHLVAQLLINEFEELGGYGVAAPSANRFGAVSPTTANAVEEELGNFLQAEDLILDGGHSRIGLESTVIDCTNDNPVVLRPGAVTTQMIQASTGCKTLVSQGISDVRAPGLMKAHYSPKAKVVIGMSADPGDGFIALKSVPSPPGVIRLASPANVEEFARVFYNALRSGDQKGLLKITVCEPGGDGLATAIRDRLSKAIG
jgi:L-threonylcarbamoyladenylate synthase